MFNFLKKKEKKVWDHFAFICSKDKSGRMRYHIYKNGKPCDEEITIDQWVGRSREQLRKKEIIKITKKGR